jgi:hypothetical protein
LNRDLKDGGERNQEFRMLGKGNRTYKDLEMGWSLVCPRKIKAVVLGVW